MPRIVSPGTAGGITIQPISSGSAFIYTFANAPYAAPVTIAFTDPNQLSYALGQGQTITVTPGFLTRTLDAGTNVTLQANDDITIDSPITETSTGSARQSDSGGWPQHLDQRRHQHRRR